MQRKEWINVKCSICKSDLCNGLIDPNESLAPNESIGTNESLATNTSLAVNGSIAVTVSIIAISVGFIKLIYSF